AVTAIACNTNKGAAPTAKSSGGAAKQPKKGGVVNYAGGLLGSFDLAGRSWDPHVQTQSGTRSLRLFYDTLLAYDLVTYDVQPWLAQKWEQPSQTEFLFHLVPNVKWQNKPPVNGRPMTTDDILWSLERARSDNPGNVVRSYLSLVDMIEAPDSSTIRITTKSPDASTLKKIATDNLSVLSRELFEKNPKPSEADTAVGTGPFLMKSVEPNVGAEYVRNPDFWQQGKPYLDSFRTRNFPDAGTAWAAFSANQIDVMVLDGPTLKSYQDQQGSGFTVPGGPDDTIGGFLYPNTKQKPLDDARVTRALRLMIDHDEMVNTLAASATGKGGIGSLFPPVLADWELPEKELRTHLEWKSPKDDAAKEAISLLTAAGFTKDKPLKFPLTANNNQQGQLGTQLIQAQWKKFSQGIVDVDIKLGDSATLDSVRANHTFSYGMFGTSVGPAEPELWLSFIYRTGASSNFMGFSDPQVDAMIDKQRAIFDDKQRRAAVREIVLYMIDHGVSTIATTYYYLHAVSKRIQNYVPETHYLNGREFSWVWVDQ
ncbi:MAG TPA: ABC transporter substrate-binding protein, partial [Dehalococcoidia bacterium]|nr:ABC transporter substrate-binding protein [Dehalococcoidia bacterium]